MSLINEAKLARHHQNLLNSKMTFKSKHLERTTATICIQENNGNAVLFINGWIPEQEFKSFHEWFQEVTGVGK